MAVLKFLPKNFQENLSEHLQTEIKVVTHGESKYYNRLYRFFQQTDVQSTTDINYETRKNYIEWLNNEELSEKYKSELISLFDRLKIENMTDVQIQGKLFSVEQEFFKKDQLFLLYVPNKQKAQSFRQVVNKEDLLWDLTEIHSLQLKRQTKILLCEILNMDITQRRRRDFLVPLKALIRFCNKHNIDNLEEMEQSDEKRFALSVSLESTALKKQVTMIVEFARRILFLSDENTNWNAYVWYLERFRIDKSRINASNPIKSLSFLKVQMKENREYLQMYAKYLIGISDLSLSNVRNIVGFVSQFLLYLDERNIRIPESEEEDIQDFTAILETLNIKYSTFNRYITHIHTFFRFLQMKEVIVPQFYPEKYLKKGYPEHNNRSVPMATIAKIIDELPTFPEHLQLMYLILLCTGIRKSEVCSVQAGAFYRQGWDCWLRVYQPKMRKEKVIPVPSVLIELVEEYEQNYGIQRGEYLFKNKYGNAFNGQTFSQQMVDECTLRGIDCGEYVFRAHDYRHSLATSLYENGVSIQGVRDYLGHASEDMTKQYVDFMPERIVTAENKYFSKKRAFNLKGAEGNEK